MINLSTRFVGVLMIAPVLFVGASSAHAEESNQDQGPSPQMSIGTAELREGEPVPVKAQIVGTDGVDPVEQIEARVVTKGGSFSLPDGRSGSDLLIAGAFRDVQAAIGGIVVTALAPGEVTLTVSAWPSGRPAEGISASRTLTAAAAEPPTPSPAPPTPTPTPTPAPVTESPEATAVASQPTAEPKPEPTVTYAEYVALDNPDDVSSTTTTAVALVVTIGAASGVLAAAGGIPGGESAPARSAASAPAGRREDDATRQEKRERTSLSGVDVSFAGLAAAVGVGDRLRPSRIPLTDVIDAAAHRIGLSLARFSPLIARLVADSTYLRAMIGSIAVFLPLLGIGLGVLGVQDVSGQVLVPSLFLLCAITLLGTLDALAGAVSVVTFIIGAALGGGVTTADGVRTMLGIAVIGFGPALIAGAFRPFRRSRDDYSAWERLTDFVLVPLFGAFAVQGMVSALPGLSGYDLPIAESANVVALVALGGLLLRIMLEEAAARNFPQRIASVALTDLPQPSLVQRAFAAAIRTALFTFIAIAFLGNVWQLWAGCVIFAVGQGLELARDNLPNSPRLYQLLPVGLLRLVIVLLVSLGVSAVVSVVFSEDSTRAQMSFVFLMLPGLILTTLGVMGRAPRDGEVRWYLTPVWRTWYRIVGVLLLVAAIGLTQFI
jgi:hypothetical protein